MKPTFAKYAGPRPLDETSIDDIPRAEQEAFFAAEQGEATSEDWDRLYAAWRAAQ